MKILFVANVAKEHINKFHIPTIKAFKNNGWTVDVACSGEEEVPICDKRFRTCWKRSPFTFKTLKGIREMKKISDEGKYDVIFCHTPVGGLVARLGARNARKNGTKIIYCAHGLHFFKGAPIINWILFYPLEKIMAHFTDVVFAVNQEDFDRLNEKFTKKTKYVLVPEVGVDFNRLNIENPEKTRQVYREEFGYSDDTTVMIYVAELLANKNQKMLVDTLEILLKKGENIKLLLVGPDHADGELKRYVEGKNLDEYVNMPGWRSDIGELMYTADICTASSIREGFGINLVEAMYCGLPVIATNNRGHKMIINDDENGYLVDIDDSKTMSDRVLELIHNEDIRSRMSDQDVSEYEADLVAEKLYNYIYRFI